MRKIKWMKRPVSLALALACAAGMILCACDRAPEQTTEDTAWTMPEIQTTETEPAVSKNPKDISPYKAITLDGVREHSVTTEEFCYIEGDKYIILLDRDITIPGDFAANIEQILDEIESQLGISSIPDTYPDCVVNNNSSYYGTGFNPWDGWEIGKKIAIFIVADREPKGYISCADASEALFCEYELFSDELWDSIPEFRDNPWRRNDYIDYSNFAHELTHTVTGRNCSLSHIMTEGIADYMGYSVVKALADKNPVMEEVLKKKNWDEGSLPETVNAENAETIFVADYNTLSMAERGPEYYYGKRLWQFLFEEYGSDAFSKVCAKLKTDQVTYDYYAAYDEAAMKKYAEYLKELFGDDIFSRFGNWCVKNNYLQKQKM